MPKKHEYVKFKNYKTQIKSPFIIYADFESIFVPKVMESKIQKILDDKFSKPFKTHLGEDVAYLIDSMIEESKYCNDVIKNILTRNLYD